MERKKTVSESKIKGMSRAAPNKNQSSLNISIRNTNNLDTVTDVSDDTHVDDVKDLIE
jgi:hypothetical protein